MPRPTPIFKKSSDRVIPERDFPITDVIESTIASAFGSMLGGEEDVATAGVLVEAENSVSETDIDEGSSSLEVNDSFDD
eukprot:CAMPEP_0196822672 /NCGR_PEP_ID=MMETSP1362-20130617/84320_1 /TAXON_ID=163516 /ORGANISM="Leptocylindrus danicus, Strain CCMP1856" /LENGTH=78 /DNA_ID=CAMNT_0042202291 /DNA_START=211 /DNA_END=447 /DNA_ORIENTATION=+